MPVYEYREGGRVVVRALPVAERDTFPNRITVPSRVHVVAGAPDPGADTLRGFHRCEERYGTESVRQCAKALGLTRDQVKKVWQRPD